MKLSEKQIQILETIKQHSEGAITAAYENNWFTDDKNTSASRDIKIEGKYRREWFEITPYQIAQLVKKGALVGEAVQLYGHEYGWLSQTQDETHTIPMTGYKTLTIAPEAEKTLRRLDVKKQLEKISRGWDTRFKSIMRWIVVTDFLAQFTEDELQSAFDLKAHFEQKYAVALPEGATLHKTTDWVRVDGEYVDKVFIQIYIPVVETDREKYGVLVGESRFSEDTIAFASSRWDRPDTTSLKCFDATQAVQFGTALLEAASVLPKILAFQAEFN